MMMMFVIYYAVAGWFTPPKEDG